MEYRELVSAVFQSIDNSDSAKFASYITSNGTFRFANIPAVKGNEAIEAYVEGFFKSLKKIIHSNLESWIVDDVILVNGNVKYTRHNNSTLEIPFSCTWKMKHGLIDQYLIFTDNSELYK